ncbi:hypothetical protein M758_11G007300 [Ceratodon purpureus]|nr:hypothetical protein M758_11G007300 [Ceratodon purpureus]
MLFRFFEKMYLFNRSLEIGVPLVARFLVRKTDDLCNLRSDYSIMLSGRCLCSYYKNIQTYIFDFLLLCSKKLGTTDYEISYLVKCVLISTFSADDMGKKYN